MQAIWIVAGIVLIILELIVPGTVLVFLGAGALLVALLIWLGLVQAWVTSLTTWFIASLVLLLVLRSFFQRYLTGDEEKQSVEEDAEAYGEVVEDIGPDNEGLVTITSALRPLLGSLRLPSSLCILPASGVSYRFSPSLRCPRRHPRAFPPPLCDPRRPQTSGPTSPQ